MGKQEINTPPVKLPKDAQHAWRAYASMLASKQAHFGYLENLDQQYRNGGKRTLAEIAHLDSLLETHNVCVKAFTSAQKSLFQENPEAHGVFIKILSESNEHLGTPLEPH